MIRRNGESVGKMKERKNDNVRLTKGIKHFRSLCYRKEIKKLKKDGVMRNNVKLSYRQQPDVDYLPIKTALKILKVLNSFYTIKIFCL